MSKSNNENLIVLKSKYGTEKLILVNLETLLNIRYMIYQSQKI